jgi:hypothetical protein
MKKTVIGKVVCIATSLQIKIIALCTRLKIKDMLTYCRRRRLIARVVFVANVACVTLHVPVGCPILASNCSIEESSSDKWKIMIIGSIKIRMTDEQSRKNHYI